MPTIENLISKYCPNGVKYKSLEELGSFFSGLSGKTKKDFENGNCKFITYLNVYKNPALNLHVDDTVFVDENEKQNCIRYGDVLFTGSSETPDECGFSSVVMEEPNEKIYLNSFCFGYRLNNDCFIPGFLKHLFRCNELRNKISKTANGVTRFNISKVKFGKIVIPVPPLPVQEEIVKILDSFTELETELKTELETRKKQYEHYRDKLLNPDNMKGEVKTMTLADIADIGTGSSNRANATENGLYPFYVRSKEVFKLDTFEFDEEAIIIPGEGGIGDIFHYVKGKYALHQRAYRVHLTNNLLNTKFLYYYMQATFKRFILSKAVSATVTSIRKPMLEQFVVPVPSLEEQERIVSILDKFDALVNDISEGLPAEIKGRHQQYEYYRDKLLDFKELPNE